ncbi:MAG: PKD domain-containing protein [Candidatus Hodarchaeota archaeon]
MKRVKPHKRVANYIIATVFFLLILSIAFNSSNTPPKSEEVLFYNSNEEIPRSGDYRDEGLEWESLWDAGGDDESRGITGDNDYIYTCGSTNSFGAGGYDALLVKWNKSSGEEIWNSTWGGSSVDKATDVWLNGSYVYTCGYTGSFGAGREDFFLIKWNSSSGSIIWNQTFGTVENEFSWCIWVNGSSIYSAGSVRNHLTSYTDLLVVKWDMVNGSVLWNVTWGDTGNEDASDITGDNDAIYICGSASEFAVSSLIIMSLDKDGNLIYAEEPMGSSAKGGYFFLEGDTLYVSGTRSSGNDAMLATFHKSNGSLIWDNYWLVTSIAVTGRRIWKNGSEIFTSCSIGIIKWDATNGTIIWTSPYFNDAYFWSDGTMLYLTYSMFYAVSVQWDLQPLANFTIWSSTFHELEPVYFIFNGLEGDGIVYQWDFGDGSPNSTEENPSHIYNSPGIYNVTLIIEDYDGDVSIIQKNLTIVDHPPVASFTASSSSIFLGAIIDFSYTGTNGSPPLSYEWNFGDGSPNSTIANPQHQYTSAGDYNVTLTVTDVDGDESEYYMMIHVDPNLTEFPVGYTWSGKAKLILTYYKCGTDTYCEQREQEVSIDFEITNMNETHFEISFETTATRVDVTVECNGKTSTYYPQAISDQTGMILVEGDPYVDTFTISVTFYYDYTGCIAVYWPFCYGEGTLTAEGTWSRTLNIREEQIQQLIQNILIYSGIGAAGLIITVLAVKKHKKKLGIRKNS